MTAESKKKISLKTAVTCAVLVIVILIGSLMTIFSYIVKRNMIVTGYGEQVTRLAQTVASAIDPDLFAQTAEDGAPAGEYWYEVKGLLDRIINETGVMFIYTVLYGGDDEVTYFATGDVYGNDEWAVEFLHLDTGVEWYPHELFTAMYTGTVTQSDIYDADEFGILIGGFAPITGSGGNVVGVACVEINVDDVIATINTSVFAMAIVALIVVVVFFVLAMIVANKGLIRPVNEITDTMSKVNEGDFNFQFPKSSIREISTLSESFGNMVQTLSTVIEEIQNRNQDIIEGNFSNERKSITAKGDYQKILDGVDAIADNMAIHMDELAKRLHTISEGIRYASKIQSDLLPKNQAFDDAFTDAQLRVAAKLGMESADAALEIEIFKKGGKDVVAAEQRIGDRDHVRQISHIRPDASQYAEHTLNQKRRLDQLAIGKVRQGVEMADVVAFKFKSRPEFLSHLAHDAFYVHIAVVHDALA